MAEWKTDTEEVKEVVDKCREFKRSLQEEKCSPFIKNLDSYALKIIVECRKIEMQLEKAKEKLGEAKQRKDNNGWITNSLQFGVSVVSLAYPPARAIGALAITSLGLVSRYMEDNIKKMGTQCKLIRTNA